MDKTLQELLRQLSNTTERQGSSYLYEAVRRSMTPLLKEAASPSFRDPREFQQWVEEKWDQGFGPLPGDKKKLRDFEKQLKKDLEKNVEPLSDEEIAQRRKVREEALKRKRKQEERRSRRLSTLASGIAQALQRAFVSNVDLIDDDFARDHSISMVVRHPSKLDIRLELILSEKDLEMRLRIHPKRLLEEGGQSPPSSFMRKINTERTMKFRSSEEFDELVKKAPAMAKKMVGNALTEIEGVYRG